MSLRERVFHLLHPKTDSKRSERWLEYTISGLILLNFLAFTWGTLDYFQDHWEPALDIFRHVSLFIFALEYLLRLWVMTEHPDYGDGFRGRISWILSPLALFDITVIISHYFFGLDLRFLRIIRLFGLFRFLTSEKYWEAVLLLRRTYSNAREALITAFLVFFIFVHLFAILMYVVEHNIQPDAFPNIPAAMWWAAVTLTTVGYGDVTPITYLGKFIATVASFTGVAMLGVPAGVIAAGLVEEWDKLKEARIKESDLSWLIELGIEERKERDSNPRYP